MDSGKWWIYPAAVVGGLIVLCTTVWFARRCCCRRRARHTDTPGHMRLPSTVGTPRHAFWVYHSPLTIIT
jgi:hypothetical protein